MLKYGREYVAPSLEAYEARMRSQQERALRRKATALGFALVPQPPSPAG